MPFDDPLSAAVLLLLMPGPTNALVAAATATEGLRRLPAALGAVLAAYGLSLTLLGLVLGRLSRRWAGAEAVNKTTAAVLAAFVGAIMVTTAVAGL